TPRIRDGRVRRGAIDEPFAGGGSIHRDVGAAIAIVVRLGARWPAQTEARDRVQWLTVERERPAPGDDATGSRGIVLDVEGPVTVSLDALERRESRWKFTGRIRERCQSRRGKDPGSITPR